MKKITLQRFVHDKVTFGKLILEWLPEHKDIYTIELPWQDNKNNISCIPQGLYNCKPYSSKKYKNVWHVLNVPGREAILIHAGNFASPVKLQGSSHTSDTEGCIMVGLGIEENVPMITKSKLAMEYLHEVLGKDNFAIEVKN
jgi:hypothetical protein